MSRPDAGQQTHYDVLGLAPSCNNDEVRQAYRKIALKHHPDRGGAGNVELFKRAVEAYEVLGDATRRRDYDVQLNPPQRPRFQSAPNFSMHAEFSDIFDFAFGSAHSRPKRRPTASMFDDFDFFSFEDPFEFSMPWSRHRSSSAFRSAPGATYTAYTTRRPAAAESARTGPSAKFSRGGERHFSERSNVKTNVQESYERGTRAEPRRASRSATPEGPDMPSNPAEQPATPAPGPTVDPAIIDLTHDSDEPRAPPPPQASPKRMRESEDAGRKTKRAKFDMHNFGAVPPFTQTNGNFSMGAMSDSMPPVGERTRQYNAPRPKPRAREAPTVPNLDSRPTLSQAVDHAEYVKKYLVDNLEHSEHLFENVGRKAEELKQNASGMVMNPQKIGDLIEGSKADVEYVRDWIRRMEAQQKMLETWKATLERLV